MPYGKLISGLVAVVKPIPVTRCYSFIGDSMSKADEIVNKDKTCTDSLANSIASYYDICQSIYQKESQDEDDRVEHLMSGYCLGAASQHGGYFNLPDSLLSSTSHFGFLDTDWESIVETKRKLNKGVIMRSLNWLGRKFKVIEEERIGETEGSETSETMTTRTQKKLSEAVQSEEREMITESIPA